MADCWALSRQDKPMLTQAQSFAIEAEEETNDPDQPLGEILVPGWDTPENENVIGNEINNADL